MTEKLLTNKPSKLFQVLQKLSTPQMTKLFKLVESPYFHQTEGVKELFGYLRKFHPQYPLKKVSNETIAKYLFPKSKNGIKKVKNFKTDLMKLIEQFLILQTFEQEDNQQQFLLTKAYQELQLPQYANSSKKKLSQVLKKSIAQGLPYLRQNLQLLHFQYYHPDTPKTLQNKETLQELLNYLDRYYVSAKYKYVHEAEERTSRFNEHFDLPLWETVQTESKNFESTNKQFLIYYYHQLQELVSQDTLDQDKFENIKQTFFSNLKYLDREDQLVIFRYLLNYITRLLNNGIPELKALQFDLYKKGLANDLIIWKKRIPTNTFLNIVIIASTCKAFDWLENFIHQNKKYIKPDLHKDVIKVSNALMAFHQGKPDQVFDILNNTPLKNHNLELYCLPLEVKSMFDMYLQNQTYYSTILSRLESFSRKLSSKYDFSGQKKESYRNYLNFVKRLVQIYNKSKNDIEAVKKLSKKILTTERVNHKSWLLEKCDQIIHSKMN